MTKASMKLPSVRASGAACVGPGPVAALLARASALGKSRRCSSWTAAT